MRSGFEYDGKQFRANNRIVTVLVLECNLGLRVGDRYRLDIIEDKTDKKRECTVPTEIYNYIKMYCLENKIKKATETIFDISEKAVKKQLKIVCDYLGLEGISTHS